MTLGSRLGAAVKLPYKAVRAAGEQGFWESARLGRKLLGGWLGGWLRLEDVLDYEARAAFLAGTWPVRRVAPNTTYVFVFVGEFGYELLNWQGVVRKFARQLPPSSDILVGTRPGLELLYEDRAGHVDISEYPPFRDSIASYYAAWPREALDRKFRLCERDWRFDAALRKGLQKYIREKCPRRGRRMEFIFSSQLVAYPGCVFGTDRRYWGQPGHPGNIYAGLDVPNNLFRPIQVDESARREIEEQLGFDLDRPYVLVQLRRRPIGPRDQIRIDEQAYIESMNRYLPVVVLSFDTRRLFDSGSRPEPSESGVIYRARSFRDQACLIRHAAKCVFFTEGDFGSHTYVPPLLGKDVVVIASQLVLSRPSAPIAFWNENVFRMGGQMKVLVAESVDSSPQGIKDAVEKILGSTWPAPLVGQVAREPQPTAP